jgi:CPA1 family monovalent cation:H+ antiporter
LILFVFLPTLVFESSFHLDSRQLRHNLVPVLILAIPGLLLSTAVIGGILHLGIGIPLTAALLLGAILSATDPVAVVALFQRLGTPQRLTILVEGESLFNDATALVLARILTGILAAGVVTLPMLGAGLIDFLLVFVGGLLVGWVAGAVTGWLLGLVEADSLIEITLTMTVAYLSFLVAEELFHVSGVMATLAAGLTLGGWGRTKISPAVRHSLEHFWEYLAFVANALIFLLVGLLIDPLALWQSRGALLLVIVALLLSRAAVIFGLMPLVGRVSDGERVARPYQLVMYWGGLRGAIAIAIVLSLPDFPLKESFVTLVIGAVLFTLLVQGLSIERLVHLLRLDQPPLADRFAALEAAAVTRQRALGRLGELKAGGLFPRQIADRIEQQTRAVIDSHQAALRQLASEELGVGKDLGLLFLRALREEQALYGDLFDRGHLREATFRSLLLILAMQIDAVRFSGTYRPIGERLTSRRRLEQGVESLLERIPGGREIAERLRLRRITRDYELAWAHFQGSRQVLRMLAGLDASGVVSAAAIAVVEEQYRYWQRVAEEHLEQMAGQFPEFVASVQERLGWRLLHLAELQEIDELLERGALPPAVANRLRAEPAERLRRLRGASWASLVVEPEELLRKVPCLAGLSADEFRRLATRLTPLSRAATEEIIRQGETGDALYLIARGVVKVERRDDTGAMQRLATLMPGDFFGEMALLHDRPRTATVKAVTPCALYRLRRHDLDATMPGYSSILAALHEADARRQWEIAAAAVNSPPAPPPNHH